MMFLLQRRCLFSLFSARSLVNKFAQQDALSSQCILTSQKEQVFAMVFKLVAVFFFVAIFGANAEKLSLQNCDSTAPIRIVSVDVRSPITIKPNARIPVNARYINRYTAGPNTLFKVHSISVKRKILWGYANVPIGGLVKGKTVKCSEIEPLSPIPLCPGELGSQQFQGTITVPPSLKVPGYIKVFGSGQYKVSADIRDATGKRIVCIKDAIVKIEL